MDLRAKYCFGLAAFLAVFLIGDFLMFSSFRNQECMYNITHRFRPDIVVANWCVLGNEEFKIAHSELWITIIIIIVLSIFVLWFWKYQRKCADKVYKYGLVPKK